MTLVYLTAAWVTGILLAKVLALPWQMLPALALAAVAALVLARQRGYRHQDVRLAAACTIALALGAGRLLVAIPRFDERSLATYNDTGEVAVEGVVTGEPDERATYTNLQIRAERLWLADGVEREVRGVALVSVPPYPRLQYGDRLRIEGALKTPPVLDTFSYREYLAYRGIYSLLRHPQTTRLAQNQASPVMHAILSFKQSARAAIAAMLPEPQAALLTGILLGVDSGIPADLTEAFSRSGTSHIIAISGFNMTLVSALLIRLAQRLLDRRRAHWVAIVGIAAYTVLVGASPAVVRAAAMSLLCLWGRLLGRRSHGPTSLAAAALAMTVSNPYLLWDVSFQLSFAATAGLVLFGKPFEQGFARTLSRLTSAPRARAIGGILNEPLIIGFAAQLLTMPIIAAHFGQLSVIAFLANLLVLPAQPAVMVTGGIATLLGMAIHPVGQLVGWVAWAFLTYTIEAAQLMARIPYALVSVHINGWALLAYYAACGGLAWGLTRRPEARRRLWGDLQTWVGRVGRGWVTQPVLAVAAAVLLVMGMTAWRTLPDGLLHVTVLDIGQGDAIFIRTPTGSQVLIDGGPDASLVLSRLGRRIPFWDRTIDG
ncbi:MAG: DUF4131 domain-containing protein, partial [Anaerolineales bacterium]|nr:DUF4131 domain-containing protein [Anaerolineales bacterium]